MASRPHRPGPSRRQFIQTASAGVALGFLGLERWARAAAPARSDVLGPLLPDPARLLDLPAGFSCSVVSRTGERMSDGFLRPADPDGMGAFPLPDGRIALVCNHELDHRQIKGGPFDDNTRLPAGFPREKCYHVRDDGSPFLGGTTTLIWDPVHARLDTSFLSLTGTDRNCAGGVTPWGTWITCEEPEDLTSANGLRHGYCFEVPVTTRPQLQTPVPIKAMGRFRHEAIAIDPRTGVVYLTEDRPDGLLYRYLPLEQGRLLAGGRMQALRLADDTRRSTRNYSGDGPAFPLRTSLPVAWIDVDDINSPRDDLRVRGHAAGAALFARGEGAWFGNGSIYFACTDGGPAKSGQIFRYTPSPGEGTPAESGAPGRLELYLEPNDARLLEACDNVTVAPWGDLIICEDGSGDQYLRLVTKSGELLTLARNAASKAEFAGACFAPGHDILFVNIFNPGMTLAIRGPWPGRA